MFIKAKIDKKESFESKSGYKGQRFVVSEDNSFLPIVIQASSEFIPVIDKEGYALFPVRVSYWSDKIKKYTNQGIVFNVVNQKDLK